MIQAIVFDLDGVLIASEETWSRVRGAVVARHGGQWTAQDQRNVMGDNSRQWAAYMQRTWQVPLSTEAIYQEVLAAMSAAYAEHLEVLPGAREAVALLAARYPLAVASSSPRPLIGVALRTAELERHFRVIVSSDEVAQGKPAPHVYRLAAARLGVPAAHCAAIEDSTNGLRAAVAAGMLTIAVPNSAYPPAADALAQARCVLRSLHDLTLELIASWDASWDAREPSS